MECAPDDAEEIYGNVLQHLVGYFIYSTHFDVVGDKLNFCFSDVLWDHIHSW